MLRKATMQDVPRIAEIIVFGKRVACKTYVLDKCGHSPFMERYAMDEFYEILHQIIS